MSLAHALEFAGIAGLGRVARSLGWKRSLGLGAALGAAVGAAGLRRRVAEENLARAFPEKSAAERTAILRAHYRELGRVALEYPCLPDLARGDEAIAGVRGLDVLESALGSGRGVILMSGHFGNFELLAAWIAQRHPVDLVVRPPSNPRVDAWLSDLRRRAGFGLIRADRGVREVFGSLRAGRAVAMLADQDARRHGVFVPFLGVPASTAVGPARMAIATGSAIVMGFATRRPDGRHELDVEPPLFAEGEGDAAALALTARHTALLGEWVRRRPEFWFWLHRRWKTAPPPGAETGVAPPDQSDGVRTARAGEA